MAERREVRAWRPRTEGGSLKAVGDAEKQNSRQQTQQTQQTDLTRREEDSSGLYSKPTANTANPAADPCVIAGCADPIAEGDLAYCAGHRAMVEAPTFTWERPDPDPPRLVRVGPTTWIEAEWARALCVLCPATVGEGDVIACPTHRIVLDAELAKLRGATGHDCAAHPSAGEAIHA